MNKDIETIEDNEPWLSDLREHVAKAAKAEYDRDWCIYGAKGDGYKMNEIAEAAGLTRQHVRRILDRMDNIFTAALDSGDFETSDELWGFIWGAKSWESFYGETAVPPLRPVLFHVIEPCGDGVQLLGVGHSGAPQSMQIRQSMFESRKA